LPKGQNTNSCFFWNTLLEAVRGSAHARTQKLTLRHFHVRADNSSVQNSSLTKEKVDEVQSIQWEHPLYSPDIALPDLCLLEWSKREMMDQSFLADRSSKRFELKCEGKWIPAKFSACFTNESRCWNMLPNREGSSVPNEDILVRLPRGWSKWMEDQLYFFPHSILRLICRHYWYYIVGTPFFRLAPQNQAQIRFIGHLMRSW
jgi:hypothetical protein